MERNVNIYIPDGKAVFYANFRVKERDPNNPAVLVSRQINRSTGSPDRRTAQRIANEMRNKALEGLFHTVPKLRDDSPTIKKLIDTYKAGSRVKSANIVARNFLVVVAEGAGILDDREKALSLRVNTLSASTMQAFRDGTHWGDRPDKPARSTTTINAIMRSAKSIFARRAMEFYRDLNLDQAAIDSWQSVTFLADRQDKRFRRIPEVTLALLDRRAEAMRRLSLRYSEGHRYAGPRPAARLPMWSGAPTNANQWLNAWGTYWLIRRCGLRNTECEELRWDWFEHHGERILLSLVPRDYWTPKGIAGDVPVAADLYASLVKAFGPVVKGPDGYVLRGTATDRHRGANHCVSGFVRKHLHGREKAVYELRKQWGSEIARRHGIETASKLLRHVDIKTTYEHYFDDLKLNTVEAL